MGIKYKVGQRVTPLTPEEYKKVSGGGLFNNALKSDIGKALTITHINATDDRFLVRVTGHPDYAWFAIRRFKPIGNDDEEFE